MYTNVHIVNSSPECVRPCAFTLSRTTVVRARSYVLGSKAAVYTLGHFFLRASPASQRQCSVAEALWVFCGAVLFVQSRSRWCVYNKKFIVYNNNPIWKVGQSP
eukprot:403168-Pleurochrysis_carterae.AAC.3